MSSKLGAFLNKAKSKKTTKQSVLAQAIAADAEAPSVTTTTPVGLSTASVVEQPQAVLDVVPKSHLANWVDEPVADDDAVEVIAAVADDADEDEEDELPIDPIQRQNFEWRQNKPTPVPEAVTAKEKAPQPSDAFKEAGIALKKKERTVARAAGDFPDLMGSPAIATTAEKEAKKESRDKKKKKDASLESGVNVNDSSEDLTGGDKAAVVDDKSEIFFSVEDLKAEFNSMWPESFKCSKFDEQAAANKYKYKVVAKVF